MFRRKIAARTDGKLHCLLGELPGALAAAGTSGEQSLPQAFDLALSHMTFHHIADVAGTRAAAAPNFVAGRRCNGAAPFKQSAQLRRAFLPPTEATLPPARRRHAAHAARPAQAGRQGGGV